MDGVQVQHVGSTAANTERGNLAHVNPDTVVWNLLAPQFKLVDPVLRSPGRVPIREDCVARPHSTNIKAAIGVLDKSICCDTSIEGRIPKMRLGLTMG
jgi:hypothetical protein